MFNFNSKKWDYLDHELQKVAKDFKEQYVIKEEYLSDQSVRNHYYRVSSKTDNGIDVQFDMPGVKLDNIKVSVVDNVLSVTGESSDLVDKRSYKYKYALNDSFDLDKLEPELRDGILHVTVPRKILEKSSIRVFKVK